MGEFFDQGELPTRVFRGFVRRVTPDMPVQCTVVSPCFWKTWVHYHGKSIGCLRAKDKCPGCKLGWPRKFLGYLYIRNEHNSKYEHLELPFEACHDLVQAIGGQELLRGTRFVAKRKGGKKGRITFDMKEHLDDVAPAFELPADVDPSGILEYLWGVNFSKLKLSADEELPSREAI